MKNLTLSESILQLHEKQFAGRAWYGKLKRIDELLSWLYDKNILNKTDKNKKDVIFNRYYRYYNDGDVPRGKKYPPVPTGIPLNRNSKAAKKIEQILEEEVTEFIKATLKKYSKKYNRKDFRKDKAQQIYDSTQVESGSDNLHTYWAKQYIMTYGVQEALADVQKLDEIEKQRATLRMSITNKIKEHYKGLKVVSDITSELPD